MTPRIILLTQSFLANSDFFTTLFLMPKFSTKSKIKLATTHPKLQTLFKEVIKHYDCIVITGHRSENNQNEMFKLGFSKIEYPDSAHNKNPSMAVDIAPWPISWENLPRFYHFAGFVQGLGKRLGIDVRWGGDWDGDMKFNDQKFNDLIHFELIENFEKKIDPFKEKE